MMKINKQILTWVLGIFLWGFLSLKGGADDSSSNMLTQLNELKGMIAHSRNPQNPTHKDWEIRNPFNTFKFKKPPEIKKAAKETNYILEGIIFGSSTPSVIINDKVVGIGSKIEGATVKEITVDRVVLIEENGKKKVLSLMR